MWDQELLEHTRQLALLRQKLPALRRGALHLLYAQGETLIFTRLLDKECLLIAMQRAGAGHITIPENPLLSGRRWQPLLGSGQIDPQDGLQLQLAECSFTLFQGTTDFE